MSVWESVETLREYVYKSVHVEYLRRRREWFQPHVELHLACWWLPAGSVPTVEEGLRRVALIREHGPGPDAFTLAKPFPAPDAADGVAAGELDPAPERGGGGGRPPPPPAPATTRCVVPTSSAETGPAPAPGASRSARRFALDRTPSPYRLRRPPPPARPACRGRLPRSPSASRRRGRDPRSRRDARSPPASAAAASRRRSRRRAHRRRGRSGCSRPCRGGASLPAAARARRARCR